MTTEPKFVRIIKLKPPQSKNDVDVGFEAMANPVASPAKFLTSMPNGAYTCIRFHRSSPSNPNPNPSPTPLRLDFHKERLLQSLRLLGVSEDRFWFDEKGIEAAVNELARHVPQDLLGKCLVTLLATVEPVPQVYGHVVYPLQINTLAVDHVIMTAKQVGSGNRMGSRSRAKFTSWIAERGPLEALKKEASNPALEVVMTTEDGKSVLEGLVTNVFVVVEMSSMEKKVFTAEKNVLHGQMRSLVIQVCKKLGVNTVLEAPPVDEISSWQELFLTSVTKPVCIVKSLTRVETNENFTFQTDGLAKQIQQKLAELL